MNTKLLNKLDELDNNNEIDSELEIARNIQSLNLDRSCLAFKAEVMAFDFNETNDSSHFYIPQITLADKKYPSFDEITEEMIHYWEKRADKTNNLVMKARYAGLVWEFAELVTKKKAHYKIAEIHIEALLKILTQDLKGRDITLVSKAKRAYYLAKRLNNKELIKRSIQSTIDLEQRIAIDQYPGRWGFCFNIFVLQKCEQISEDKRCKILNDLESRFTRVSLLDYSNPCEYAGVALARYYRSKHDDKNLGRVIETMVSCIKKGLKKQSPLTQYMTLKRIYDLYIENNFQGKAKELLPQISELNTAVYASLKEIAIGKQIEQKQLNEYIHGIIDGGFEVALHNISSHFGFTKAKLKRDLHKQAELAPPVYQVSKQILDFKGRHVATIRELAKDEDGQIIHLMSQHIAILAVLLHLVIKKMIDRYNVNVDDFIEYVYHSPLFDESSKGLLKAGITAYLKADYISATHILTPQIEAAIRNLVERKGNPVLKENRFGGFQYRTLDDLIRDQSVIDYFGEDTVFYFTSLLTDQRGINIRNYLCHGLFPSFVIEESFLADRVMHVILLIAWGAYSVA